MIFDIQALEVQAYSVRPLHHTLDTLEEITVKLNLSGGSTFRY